MRQDSYQEHNTANQRDSLFLKANEGQASRFLYHKRQPQAFFCCQSERSSRIKQPMRNIRSGDSFLQQGARSFTPDIESQSERGPRMLSANEKHSSLVGFLRQPIGINFLFVVTVLCFFLWLQTLKVKRTSHEKILLSEFKLLFLWQKSNFSCLVLLTCNFVCYFFTDIKRP